MSSTRPVTVAIATRDRVPLLCRALRSVWAQKYDGPIHAVVVFDGPLPEALDLPAPERGQHTLQVVTNGRAPGVAGARNQALDLTDTELLAILDDDDEWLPGKLARQVALYDAHPSTAGIGGSIRVVTAAGPPTVRRGRPEVHLGDLLDERIMAFHTSTLLLRSDALVKIGGWDEALPGGFAEDYDLLLRLARDFGTLRMVDEPVVDIHWDVRSFYKSKWQMIAAALEMMLDKFPEFASSPTGRAKVEGQIAFCHAALGNGAQARAWIRRAWRDNRREPRTALAAVVLTRAVSADQIQRMLNARGRGI